MILSLDIDTLNIDVFVHLQSKTTPCVSSTFNCHTPAGLHKQCSSIVKEQKAKPVYYPLVDIKKHLDLEDLDLIIRSEWSAKLCCHGPLDLLFTCLLQNCAQTEAQG